MLEGDVTYSSDRAKVRCGTFFARGKFFIQSILLTPNESSVFFLLLFLEACYDLVKDLCPFTAAKQMNLQQDG